MPIAFCPSSLRLHRSRRKGGIVPLPSTATTREAVAVDGQERKKVDSKSILLLHQRKLPRQILNCRGDATRALGILADTYPHLSFQLEEENTEISYEKLIAILDEGLFIATDDATMATSGNALLIDGKSVAATMEVLRKAQNVPAALQLLRLSVEAAHCNRRIRTLHRLQDEDINELRRIYKSVLSLLGHCNRQGASNNSSDVIMHILHHMPNVAGIQPREEMYHAAINALGRLGQCDMILDLLRGMEHSHELATEESIAEVLTSSVPPVDRMSYQTAISSLARHGHCNEAAELLSRMQSKGFRPDANIYNELLVGIAKEAGRHGNSSSGGDASMALQILQQMKTHNLQPTEQAYNSVISACGKEGRWKDAARVAERAGMTSSSTVAGDLSPKVDYDSSLNLARNSTTATYFESLQCFRKMGKGKDSWWEIGRYELRGGDKQSRSMIIGIQPHRNPMYNGLSLVFFDEKSEVKLGRILLRNTSSQRLQKTVYCSSLVGMEVNASRRGEGLSKVLVAIWLRLCLETNAYPRAAVMNKPLVSYVLKGFDFVPQNGGCRVELVRLKKGEDGFEAHFGLYSSMAKSLQGLFSQRVLRTQNIAILDHPPSPGECRRGSFIYLKTRFEHPISILENAVEFDPHPLASKELSLERHRSDKGTAIRERRKQLDDQVSSVLKTSAKGDTSDVGKLDFFASNALLKRGFLSYAT